MSYPGYLKRNKRKTFKSRTQIYASSGDFFIIDNEDYEKIKSHTWNIHRNKYGKVTAVRTTKYKSGKFSAIFLHRLLLNAQKSQIVDHIDRNPKNNRRLNLRFSDATKNAINRSVYKGKDTIPGIYRNKKSGRYIACVVIGKKRQYLGAFQRKEDAEKVILETKQKYFGSFSPIY